MATQSVSKVSEEEYLRRERAAEYKSEFVGGETFAMAGGSLRHSQIAANFVIELGVQLRDRDCNLFSSDARIRTSLSGSYVYPDVSVLCGKPELHNGDSDVLTNPMVVIEVLSPSTADYDRGRKFELYREIPSLMDYVLVHTETAHIEHFARQDDASWIFREYAGLDASISVSSIGCTVKLAEVYARVFTLPV